MCYINIDLDILGVFPSSYFMREVCFNSSHNSSMSLAVETVIFATPDIPCHLLLCSIIFLSAWSCDLPWLKEL